MANSPLKHRIREAAKSSARQAILEAAEKTFVADGVAGASMQSIALRAGTSVGTLYNYFEDKDALVRALFDDRRRVLQDRVDAAVAAVAAAGFEVQLRAIVHVVLSHFDEHRAFLAIVLSTDVTAPLKKRGASTFLRERVAAVVARGVDEGVVDARLAPLITTSLSGTLRAVLIDGVDVPGSFVAHVDDVVALVLHGVLRAKHPPHPAAAASSSASASRRRK